MAAAVNKYVFGPWQVELRIVKEWPRGVLRAKQVHGGNIVAAEALNEKEVEADGIILSANNVNSVGIYTADCLPLVITTPKQALLLHVSRKTLLTAQLEQIPSLFSVNQITHVFIGPHICADHFSFEYAGEEITSFVQKFPYAVVRRQSINYLSLETVVRQYLDLWGVEGDKIIQDERCTYASNLPSYQRARQQQKTLNQHLATIVSYNQQTGGPV